MATAAGDPKPFPRYPVELRKVAEELNTIALCLRAFGLEGIAQRLEEIADSIAP